MKLPSMVDYQAAVQNPDIAFLDADLRRGQVRRTPLRAPAVASGGFALTYDVTAGRDRFAVRCFHKQGNNLQTRYSHIAEFIRQNSNLDFLIDVRYLGRGIQVNGNPFPVVRMPWVSGIQLSSWIEDNLHRRDALASVRRTIADAVAGMRQLRVAHGDLQHGNILITKDNAVRFVDYDGMYLPALAKLGAAERGHRNYQHPDRADVFDETLDLFSALVIDLSLDAVGRDSSLWEKFNTGENLLFSAEDFTSPEKAPVFRRLAEMSGLAERAELLANACRVGYRDAMTTLLGGAAVPSDRRRTGQTTRRRTGPQVILATELSRLFDHQGDEVTIFGKVVNGRFHETGGKKTCFINFGDYRKGAFTIVAFGQTAEALHVRCGPNLEKLRGKWIATTGLLSSYQSRWFSSLTPQVELRSVRGLLILDQNSVRAYQAAMTLPEEETPTVRAADDRSTFPTTDTRPPTPSSPADNGLTSPRSRTDIEDRLGRLYANPTFAQPAQQHQPTSPPRQPTPQPPPTVPRTPTPQRRTSPLSPPLPATQGQWPLSTRQSKPYRLTNRPQEHMVNPPQEPQVPDPPQPQYVSDPPPRPRFWSRLTRRFRRR